MPFKFANSINPVPPSPSIYRYLNSGTWMGYAEVAVKMLEEVQLKAGSDWDTANDQVCTYMYMYLYVFICICIYMYLYLYSYESIYLYFDCFIVCIIY